MDILEQGIVKTRKPHKCWGCREVLPAGTKVYRCKAVDAGTISTSYWCPACRAVYQDLDRRVLVEDGIAYGDIADNESEKLAAARERATHETMAHQ